MSRARSRAALALACALAFLGACGGDDATEVTPSTTAPPSAPATTDSTPDRQFSLDDDGALIALDNRYTITVAEGWDTYPAELIPEELNNSLVHLDSVAESGSNSVGLISGWVVAPSDRDVSNFALWRANAEPVLVSAGGVTEEATTVTIDGRSTPGLQVEFENDDGSRHKQVLYPIFLDGGNLEFAFQAPSEGFDELLPDVIAMLESVTLR